MNIARDRHLQKLLESRHNGLIKVITGMRRCGKSYLLNKLFKEYLLKHGVEESRIIQVSFDMRRNKPLCNPDKLCEYVESRVTGDSMHYILLDEIQMVEDFESVLNEFLHYDNMDIYVTGSNSKFLSSDIITEFRGRGFEIHIQPLSFAEYLPAHGGDRLSAWTDFLLYGGLPFLFSLKTDEQKSSYLKSLFREVYMKDIMERNKIHHPEELGEILGILSSSVGSLTNPYKLSNTFLSNKKHKISPITIAKYCGYLQNAFLINKVERYDIKGKRYINSPFKYYFEDIGLRNAYLNFRQHEQNHLMENIIYNELLLRGYNVDVGIINIRESDISSGSRQHVSLEVDFIANLGSKRFYIQSAFHLPNAEKIEQENRSLRKINDSFKKIIVTDDIMPLWRNEDGFLFINILDFLLNPDSLEL